MLSLPPGAAAALALLSLAACAHSATQVGPTPAHALKGSPTMNATGPSADRPPPPDVPAVLHKGVRYEQDLQGHEPAGTAEGGTLKATDAGSGKLLWRLQVYTVRDHATAGVETPGRYFKSMQVAPGTDELQIEDEVGVSYRVDLQARSVRRVGGPPETVSPPPAPAKPKPKP